MASQSNTGITTTTKNVCIPIDNAGIGDVIAIKSDATGDSKSDFIAVVGSSVQTTPPSGYLWYGSVYGREREGLMIRAFVPTETKWATTEGGVSVTLDTSAHANVISNTTKYAGLMRNGFDSYNKEYVGMSVGEIIDRCGSSSTTTALHPDSPYMSGGTPPMSKANFEADTNLAKTIYGTYENYVAQLLTIMKGSKSGVFGKRCGKINTKELATAPSTDGYTFPAADYCYTYSVGSESANHWWLPDMYELAVMMSDLNFEACQVPHSILGGNTSRDIYRWSSVRYNATRTWRSDNYGFSNTYGYLYYKLTTCPVTLIEL